MRKTLIAGIMVACLTTSANAENAACWGDDTREDISCTRITENLLLFFRGQTRDYIRKSMNAPGREIKNGLRFLSNYSKSQKLGSGDVNVTFEDGRVTIVSASVDSPSQVGHFEFVWNAYAAPSLGEEFDRANKNFKREPFCSDFSGKPAKCKGDKQNTAYQLTRFQIQFGSTKAELREVLETSCNPKGVVVSDPYGDCARLRELLR